MTRDRLRALLSYHPETGVFRWRVRPNWGGRTKAGDVAGAVQDNGYRYIKIDGRFYRAHRLAFVYMGVPLPAEVDHDNRVRDDNRWSNLRPSDRPHNMRNKGKYRSGNPATGVSWRTDQGRWVAYINRDGKRTHLGYFTSLADAVAARLAANGRFGFSEGHGRA